MNSSLAKRSLKHIWHPCSQMKVFETFPMLEVVKSEGSYLYLQDGTKIIDAISSWWCKTLGHQHPRLRAALQKQMEKFEHVIFANTTNAVIVQLSEKLCGLTKTLNKIFYANDGSSAVEIALKMSLHARQIQGSPRKKFVTLANGYHGETIGALSVSDVGIYKKAYEQLLFPCEVITPPYIHETINHDTHWQSVMKKLSAIQEEVTAIIVEPIVQATSNMKMYDPDFLKCLREFTKQHNIHLIADEIMTGFARTGKMFACEHAEIEPDFLCIGKGLTGGWLPFSAMMTSDEIFDLFYSDDFEKSFLHSHTFSGNVLAASIANEVIEIIEEEKLCERAMMIGAIMREQMQIIAEETQKLINVRQIGAVVAADLVSTGNAFASREVFHQAIKLGALLRPLGNTIYWLPPLTTSIDTLLELKKITLNAINASFNN